MRRSWPWSWTGSRRGSRPADPDPARGADPGPRVAPTLARAWRRPARGAGPRVAPTLVRGCTCAACGSSLVLPGRVLWKRHSPLVESRSRPDAPNGRNRSRIRSPGPIRRHCRARARPNRPRGRGLGAPGLHNTRRGSTRQLRPRTDDERAVRSRRRRLRRHSGMGARVRLATISGRGSSGTLGCWGRQVVPPGASGSCRE
jgi:hypothetical protein